MYAKVDSEIAPANLQSTSITVEKRVKYTAIAKDPDPTKLGVQDILLQKYDSVCSCFVTYLAMELFIKDPCKKKKASPGNPIEWKSVPWALKSAETVQQNVPKIFYLTTFPTLEYLTVGTTPPSITCDVSY